MRRPRVTAAAGGDDSWGDATSSSGDESFGGALTPIPGQGEAVGSGALFTIYHVILHWSKHG
jgi:hypothetical protein